MESTFDRPRPSGRSPRSPWDPSLLALTETATIPFLALDADERVRAMNAVARALFGLDESASGSLALHELLQVTPADRGAWGGGTALEIVRADGARFPARSVDRIDFPEGALVIVRDRRRTTRDPVAVDADARRQVLVGRLAARVAPEMTALFRRLEACAEALAADPAHSAEIEPLTAALRQASRLAARLDSALGGRCETDGTPSDLVHLVARTLPALGSLAGPAVSVRFDHPGVTVPVVACPARIDEVLLNLTANAREAMGSRGGTIRVAVEPPRPAGPDRAGPRLVVSDNGPGMEAGTAARVWERGWSTRGADRGLGLALCRDAADALGGRIWLTTRVGQGTSVTLELPAPHETPEGGAAS